MHNSRHRKHDPKFGKKDTHPAPVKNQIYCKAAKRAKLWFSTEHKAEQHLIYIKDQDFVKKPIRSYYCTSCRAWHVTSQPYDPKKPSQLQQLLMEMYAPEELTNTENDS